MYSNNNNSINNDNDGINDNAFEFENGYIIELNFAWETPYEYFE